MARKKKALGYRVSVAAGGGMSHVEIAAALGLSVVALEEQYATELAIGAHERRMELIEALHSSAATGNVAASKMYLSLAPKIEPTPVPIVKPPKAEKIGKKEQRNVEARTAGDGTEWDGLLPSN